MIMVWYEHRGQRPNRANAITKDANKATSLPDDFKISGVTYGRVGEDGSVDSNLIGLKVPIDSLSTDATDAIAAAFEDNWGGTVSHVETVQS